MCNSKYEVTLNTINNVVWTNRYYVDLEVLR